MKKHTLSLLSFILLSLLFFDVQTYAQVSHLDNSGAGGSATDYLGWDGFATFPLPIRNDAAEHIQFWTSNTCYLTLRGNNNSPYTGGDNTGYFGVHTVSPRMCKRVI